MTENRGHGRRPQALTAALMAAALLVLPQMGAAQLPKDKGLPPGGLEKKPVAKGGKGKEAEKGLLVSKRLEFTDPQDPLQAGHHAKTFTFKMLAGHRYIIDMTSGDFDAYLRLLDAAGVQLAFNDDNGSSHDARINYLAPRTGTYRIIATTFRPGAIGHFTLHVTPLGPGSSGAPPPPGPVGGPIRMIGNQMTFGAITITAEPPLVPVNRGRDDTHGYIEYRFTIRNESADAHRVAVKLPRQQGTGRGNHLRWLRRAVEVGPKATANLSLFQPDLPMRFGNEVEVEIDGQVQEETLLVNLQHNRGIKMMPGMMYGGPPGRGGTGMRVPAYILAPQELAQALDLNAYKSAIGAPRGLASAGAGVFGSRSGEEGGIRFFYEINHAFTGAPEPKTWGCERWLGFSCFDGVALRGQQLDELPPATREALWRYVECGGGLLLVGEAKLPEGWKRRQGSIEGLTAYYPGFGQCLVVEDTDARRWQPAQWRAILRMWEESAEPWLYVSSANSANDSFPVVDDRGIPVRGLFVGMLAFAFLVGPVNIHFLTRKKRRLWLLWTVPVFSLLTCVAVFCFMVIAEGWSGQARTTGVTVLDEVSQRASSVSWLGVYSPITPGDGLHFGYDTEVTPHLKADFGRYYRYRDGWSRTIDWTHDQHFQSGWVKALVPAHFMVRTSAQRLERLAVHRQPDGTLKAVNALKAPVVRLWVADAAGKIHVGENIPAGKEVTLQANPLRAEGKMAALREGFAGYWLKLNQNLQAHPEEVLRPGTYLAVLDGSPFLEQGLRGAELRSDRSVVFGILKEIPGDAR